MIIPTYKSLEEKAKHFTSITIDTKDGFDELVKFWTTPDGGLFNRCSQKKYIFRGLAEAKYKLYNSAQRFWNGQELNKLGRTYQEFIQKEIDSAKSFQANLLYKFYDAFGHPPYDISILSFLQHYGAPTPLLDFTYCFDCAAFFATEGLTHNPSNDIDNYCSIYSIELEPLQREFPSILNHISSSLDQIDNILGQNKDKNIDTTSALQDFEELQYKAFHDLRLFYIPGYMPSGFQFKLRNKPNFNLVFNQHNLNIINQEGLFVFNSEENHPLEDLFSGGFGTGFQSTFLLPKMNCWNIHKSLSAYIIQYLTEGRNIPINKTFIYPKEELIAQNAFQDFKKIK